MKFGKEFASQMVPEWKEAYMDYNNLKGILKRILRSREPESSSSVAMASTPKGSLMRRLTLYRAFSGLTGRRRDSPRSNEDEVILIREGEEEGLYHTTFLRCAEDGGEQELLFFAKLDNEFNKVNSFYKKEVKEVMEEAEELNRQMDALIALRVKVDKVEEFTSSISNPMEHHMTDESPSKSICLILVCICFFLVFTIG